MVRTITVDEGGRRVVDEMFGIALLGDSPVAWDQWLEGDLCVWVEGDVWSSKEGEWFRRPAQTIGERFAGGAERRARAELNDLGGRFVAIVRDTGRSCVHILTDPFGLLNISWTRWRGGIAWSTSYRAFLGLPGFSPELEMAALEDFIGLQYIAENRTWFKGVELVPPGTVLTIDTSELRVSVQAWSDRSTAYHRKPGSTIDETAEELGSRFRRAVADAACTGEVRPGLTLSGGRDSRAILGALSEVVRQPYCLTRGILHSYEVEWAVRAARVVGARHEVYPLGPDNWLRNRAQAVWKTEAMSSFRHFNGAPTVDHFAAHANLALGGEGAVTYQGRVRGGMVERMGQPRHRALVDQFLGKQVGDRAVERWREWMRTMPSPGVALILGNERRRASGHRIERAWGVHARSPFLSPDLLSMVLSLPEEWLKDGRIYRRMLAKCFPALFGTIPSTKEAPLAWCAPARGFGTILMKARGRTGRILGNRGFPFRDRRRDQVPEVWLREAPAKELVKNLLLRKRPRCGELLPASKIVADVDAHMSGKDRTRSVTAILTLELWLRQLEDESYRNGLERIDWQA